MTKYRLAYYLYKVPLNKFVTYTEDTIHHIDEYRYVGKSVKICKHTNNNVLLLILMKNKEE